MVSQVKTNCKAIEHLVKNDPIASYSYPGAQAELKDDVVTLTLDPNTQVTYPLSIDSLIETNGVNSAVAQKVHIAFRKMKLKIVNAEVLQRRLRNIALTYAPEVQTLIQQFSKIPSILAGKLREIYGSPAFQTKYHLQVGAAKQERKIAKISKNERSLLVSSEGSSGPSEQDMLNLDTDDIFTIGVAASQGAENQEVLMFVGNTGTGKSTCINDLMGCPIRRIPKEHLGVTDKVGLDLLIAENPATSVGHHNISKTSLPIVIPDKKNKFAYCDCPGFKDTRGRAVEIYNAMSIIDVIRRSKSVKGFLLFIDCSDLKSQRGKSIIDNIRFLWKLLGKFTPHERAVLFVITKADLAKDKLPDIKEVLKQSIREIALDHENEKPFRKFCEEIFNSGIFDDKLGDRVRIYDPSSRNTAQERADFVQLIRGLTHVTNVKPDQYGYPVSDKVEMKYEMTRVSLIFHLQKVLTSLKQEIRKYWEGKTKEANIQETKACLDEISEWLKNIKEEIAHFGGKTYEKVSEKLTNEINQSLNYWGKLNELTKKPQEIENISDNLKNIVTELKAIRDEVENLYYKRIYEAVKSSLETGFQAYSVQSNLKEMRTVLGTKKLSDLTDREFCELLKNLATKAGLELQYQNELSTMLAKDSARKLALEKVIRDNIIEPVNSTVNQGVITIVANASKVALSEIVEKVQDSIQSATEIWITVQTAGSQIGTLFFDTALSEVKFQGKTVYIQADKIEIMKESAVNLDRLVGKLNCGGSLTIKGQLKGSYQVQNKQVVFSTQTATTEHRIYRFQWPLEI